MSFFETKKFTFTGGIFTKYDNVLIAYVFKFLNNSFNIKCFKNARSNAYSIAEK